MVALTPSPGSTSESLHTVVADRLRAQIGVQYYGSRAKVARLCGWSRMYMHRRYSGETPLDVNDMAALQQYAGIGMHYLLTGESECSALDHLTEATTGSGSGLPDPVEYLKNRINGIAKTSHTKPRAPKSQRIVPLPWSDSNRTAKVAAPPEGLEPSTLRLTTSPRYLAVLRNRSLTMCR